MGVSFLSAESFGITGSAIESLPATGHEGELHRWYDRWTTGCPFLQLHDQFIQRREHTVREQVHHVESIGLTIEQDEARLPSAKNPAEFEMPRLPRRQHQNANVGPGEMVPIELVDVPGREPLQRLRERVPALLLVVLPVVVGLGAG